MKAASHLKSNRLHLRAVYSTNCDLFRPDTSWPLGRLRVHPGDIRVRTAVGQGINPSLADPEFAAPLLFTFVLNYKVILKKLL